jgi:ribosomal protein L16 Arg81 hydroxylase
MGDYTIEQRLFYLNELLSSDLAMENYKSNTPFMFSKKVSFDITWDEILSLVNEDINDEISTNQDYYNGAGFRITRADRIKKVSLVVDQIEDLFQKSKNAPKERPSRTHQIYVNYTTHTNLNSVPPHSDNDNVFFWQVQGRSLWTIYAESFKTAEELTEDDISHTFELNPGDMIYCPKYRKHTVTTLSPRAGISLGFNNPK